MNAITELAIFSVQKSVASFCKFISANDAGITGAHQDGFYMPKKTIPLMFDRAGIKGENLEKLVRIKWQNDFFTDSRFEYYGKGTRNEYRLTRFGKGFPFFEDDNVGDLMVLSKIEDDLYEGFVLSFDEDIEDFFAAFNLSSEQTNKLIDKSSVCPPEEKLKSYFLDFAERHNDFPSTEMMSTYARDSYLNAFNVSENTIEKKPDEQLLRWIDAEYELFKFLEIKQYGERIKSPFASVEELVTFSNTILNRRKSRAGKSLEHHLAKIFTVSNLKFEAQVITEENKRPDFIFPGSNEYHDFTFPGDKLTCLGAKTTCKDRWRQVINEADRVSIKHLFTLQQGISKNQLTEMYSNNVCLVVPKPYLKSFDKSFQDKILSLDRFTYLVKEKQI